MKRNSKKGFTLAELLIVVAIIAILVAIMLPVFGAQLDKARLATDLANVRAAYSEQVTNSMLGTEYTLSGNDVSASCKIDLDALANACTYKPVKVSFNSTEHEITVLYNSKYSASFEVDSDVTADKTEAEKVS